MKRSVFNRAVECIEVSTPMDNEAVFARLPHVARLRVESDLQMRGVAQHFDSISGLAYHFIRRGLELTVWIWCCLGSHDEAAKLLLALDEIDRPLNEQLASSLFTNVTGRSVNEPHPPMRL